MLPESSQATVAARTFFRPHP